MDVLERGDGRARARRCARSARSVRFGHALIRDTLYDDLTRGPADAAPPGGRRGARGRLRSPTPSRTSQSSRSTSSQPPRLAGTRRSITPAARATGPPPARLRGGGASLRDRADARRRPSSRRCELLLALGDAERAGGQLGGVEAGVSRAAELAERGGLAQQLARAALGYGGRFAWARASATRTWCRCWSVPSRRSASETAPRGSSCSPGSRRPRATIPGASGGSLWRRRRWTLRGASATR